ncbi:MAG: ABC transporter permease subunit [Saprospiraceae bacterium]
MLNLLKIELFKISRKPRSYIGFVAITTIVLLIEMALYVDGNNYMQFFLQQLETSFQIEGNLLTGNLVCFIILQTLIIQMPLLVALVTGDLISGEAASGTIRFLLTKPYSRTKILFSKFIAGNIYVAFLLIWLGILALGGGLLIFGDGDHLVLKSEELVILRQGDTLWRFIAAFGIAFLSLGVVAAFSLMLSCFTDNSIGPIVSSMAVIILFTIIGSLELPIFDSIKPFLFTTHMIVWRTMFDNPIDWTLVSNSLLILVFHILLFLGISWYHFKTKDINQ